MLPKIVQLSSFPSYPFQSLKMSFLSTRRFFCYVYLSSNSDFSSSYWLGCSYPFISLPFSFFMLASLIRNKRNKITLKVSRWFSIQWSLTKSKSVFVFLNTNLINDMFCSLFINVSSLLLFYCFFILFYILVSFNIVSNTFILISHLYEEFFDLSKRFNSDFFHITLEIFLSNSLLNSLFFRCIRIISNSSSSRESIVHG